MATLLELISTAGRFLVGLWPLMFLMLLVGIFRRQNGFGAMLRTSIKALMGAWVFFALLRTLFFFLKMDTFHLFAEPANTKYFLVTGLVLLPFIFSIYLEERKKKLNANTIADMQALSSKQFEQLVAEAYHAQGHQVEIVGSTGDHGIDLIVHTRKGETCLVQCKKYRGKVGEPVIRDFYGALRASNADSGAVVTSGLITDSARLWAEGKPLHLYDGGQFLKIIQSTRMRASLPVEAVKAREKQPIIVPMIAMQPAYQAASAAAPQRYYSEPEVIYSHASEAPAPEVELGDKGPFMDISGAPDCPICGVPMVKHSKKWLFFKTAEKYICSNAPACTETRPIE